MKSFLTTTLVLSLFLITTGCLKTRAQLKDESDDSPTKPVPAHAQDLPSQSGGYAIDEMRAEITRLNGRIEDLERAQKDQTAGASAAPTKDDLKKLDIRMRELETSQATMIEQLKKLQETLPPSDPKETFDKAKSDFEDGNFESAAEGFGAYLRVPGGKKTEDAAFLRGESFFNLKQYKKAIVEYSKFPEKYSKSKRMASALYKIGLSFDALGMKEDAKSFYQELVEKFPKAPEAKRVKSKLR